jgi:hypothetical protein
MAKYVLSNDGQDGGVATLEGPGHGKSLDPGGLYIRAFCISDRLPPIASIVDWAAAREVPLAVESAEPYGPNAKVWDELVLRDQRKGETTRLSCSRDDGSDDCLMRSEVDWFIKRIGPALIHPGKHRVLGHLRSTRLIVATRMADSAAYDPSSLRGGLVGYLAQRGKGLVQADGQGFFDKGKLVLRLGRKKR